MAPVAHGITIVIHAWIDDDGVRGIAQIEDGPFVSDHPSRSVEELCDQACDSLRGWLAQQS